MRKKWKVAALAVALLAVGGSAHAYSYIPLPPREKPAAPVREENRVEINPLIPHDACVWNGHAYYLYDNAASWEEAERFCQSLGGHLATISSQRENDILFDYMQSLGYRDAYFGYADSLREGNWSWVNGEPPRYENWAHGEPNGENSREDYAMFYHKFKDGTWNDGDFGGRTANGGTAFLCEWDSLYE